MTDPLCELADRLGDDLARSLVVQTNSEMLTRRTPEPEPIGHEHFEHLREEGA
jgi:hypothetical protein